MREIDLGGRKEVNPREITEVQRPTISVIFDEKVSWDDLPFTAVVDSQKLSDFMRHADMSDEEIAGHKLLLYWSRGRTFLASYYGGNKEIKINVNLFSDNKGRNHLSELSPSKEELQKVEASINHHLHHEIGHAVDPEELRKGWTRRTILMILGSLSLPEAAFLLKEMSISKPTFAEASLVAWVSASLLGLSLVWRNKNDPAEISAQRFAREQGEDERWKGIIKLSPKFTEGA